MSDQTMYAVGGTLFTLCFVGIVAAIIYSILKRHSGPQIKNRVLSIVFYFIGGVSYLITISFAIGLFYNFRKSIIQVVIAILVATAAMLVANNFRRSTTQSATPNRSNQIATYIGIGLIFVGIGALIFVSVILWAIGND